ncbi:hypothetical protein C7U60_07950 [Mesorhizobium plurifarium]|nr:hypothetical protein C7U60_07950 [Mesorhizobium plurifarium]
MSPKSVQRFWDNDMHEDKELTKIMKAIASDRLRRRARAENRTQVSSSRSSRTVPPSSTRRAFLRFPCRRRRG